MTTKNIRPTHVEIQQFIYEYLDDHQLPPNEGDLFESFYELFGNAYVPSRGQAHMAFITSLKELEEGGGVRRDDDGFVYIPEQ